MDLNSVLKHYKESFSVQKRRLKVATFLMLSSVSLERFFGDFVVLAKQSLDEGHKDVAAVLASAALEDALKRYAKVNGLNVEGATMAKVISAIKSKGLVSGASNSILDSMLRIRNYTMHAEWEKVNEPDVNSIIGFVEQFLLQKFSS